MTLQDIHPTQVIGAAAHPAVFADPEWRGAMDERANERALRPLSGIRSQIQNLAAWIAGGGRYGWLGLYQARRAGFELQSIRAQIGHEMARNDGRLTDDDRRAIQSRLDRLQSCLETARATVGVS